MAPIRSVEVGGLRGFATSRKIELSVPSGREGSGITILVGANNSGKSTVIEALRACSRPAETSYSIGKRNHRHSDLVRLTLEDMDGRTTTLETVPGGGAQTFWSRREIDATDITVIQSRRGFDPQFDKYGEITRWAYQTEGNLPANRPQSLDHQFSRRLFSVVSKPELKYKFDELLKRLLLTVPEWTIDQDDSGKYFIRLQWWHGEFHSSEGVGEGIISLFSIVDALYDSSRESLVVIDEPELSLHPQLQRRLRSLLSEYAATRQIVYTTHSPYFIDWGDIENGAAVVRMLKNADHQIECWPAGREEIWKVSSLRNNDFNPHVLGLNAAEVFFLEDGVILTEGQEDVIYFEKVDKLIGKRMSGSFFGWGVGGAGNMKKILALLVTLGYRQVVAIFDGDKEADAMVCRSEFPDYQIEVLPADDIRTKPAQDAREEKRGLIENGKLNEEFRSPTMDLYARVNSYLNASRG